jgi:hypothetical protein
LGFTLSVGDEGAKEQQFENCQYPHDRSVSPIRAAASSGRHPDPAMISAIIGNSFFGRITEQSSILPGAIKFGGPLVALG